LIYINQKSFDFFRLKELAETDPVNAIIKCCEEPFLDLLTDSKKGKDWVYLELQAIASSLEVDDTMISYKNTLKTELLFNKPQFLTEVGIVAKLRPLINNFYIIYLYIYCLYIAIYFYLLELPEKFLSMTHKLISLFWVLTRLQNGQIFQI